MCPPALHITLGVFFRLFTLLEDACHELDLEMAESTATTPNTSDKEKYQNFTATIQRERELLDKRKRLEDEVKWLDQTLSLMIISNTSITPTSTLPAQVVASAIKGKKEDIENIVRINTHNLMTNIFILC